jgi:hypothetical protein
MSTSGYTIRENVLKRWRDQLMTLTQHDDGGVEASFTFEGSSCGNFPFSLVYQVVLGEEASGYPIKEMECHAAPGSVGHERQCSYLNTQGKIMETANSEKPLLGKSLEKILEWRPETSPAGCLCSTASRNHKWLAVLQTLHFALQHDSLER